MKTQAMAMFEGDSFMPEKAEKVERLAESGDSFILAVARVSDASQRPALPAQRKRLVEYVEKRPERYAYAEFDESAYYGKARKTFSELVLQPLKQAEGLVIVTFDKIDRYTRDSSSEEKSIMTKLMRAGKIELHFPADNLFVHKDSPAADLFRLDIGVALASYYSSAIRDNVRRKFEQKLADQEWPGKAPIGYRNIIVGYTTKGDPIKDIEADPEKRQFVREAFEMRAAGLSYGAITKELRKKGMVSSIKKKPIPKTQVQHFLMNPFYSGTMVYEGKQYPHKYEPLIDPWMWQKVKAVDAKRSKQRTKLVGKEYLFKDMLRCGTCGYTVSTDGPKNGGNYYLKCTEYGGKHGAKWVNEKVINAQIVAILESFRIPGDMLPKLVEDLEREFNGEQDYYKRQVDSLQKEYKRLDEEIKDMFRDRSKFKIKPELFEELIGEKAQRQADVLEQIKDHSQGNERFVVSASKVLEVASRASEIFLNERTPVSTKRRLIQFVLSNTQLEGSTLVFELNSAFSAIADAKKMNAWGERWGSNPRPTGPQPVALTN